MSHPSSRFEDFLGDRHNPTYSTERIQARTDELDSLALRCTSWALSIVVAAMAWIGSMDVVHWATAVFVAFTAPKLLLRRRGKALIDQNPGPSRITPALALTAFLGWLDLLLLCGRYGWGLTPTPLHVGEMLMTLAAGECLVWYISDHPRTRQDLATIPDKE